MQEYIQIKYMNYINMSLHYNYQSNEPRRRYKPIENSIDERKVTFDPEERSLNVNRRIMERGDMFNFDTRNSSFDRPGREFPNSNRFGEF